MLDVMLEPQLPSHTQLPTVSFVADPTNFTWHPVSLTKMVEVVKVVKVVGVAEVSLKLRLTQLEGWVDPSSSKNHSEDKNP